MAPPRKRTRGGSNVRQRSIVDFFSKQQGPSAVGSPGSLSPVASRRTARTEDMPDQNPRRSRPKGERTMVEKMRRRKQHSRCAADGDSPRSDEEMLVVNNLFQEVSPGTCTEVEDCEDIPMTQEEEDVNDQLRSLNCSQDGLVNPGSSAAVAVDIDAPADRPLSDTTFRAGTLGTVVDLDTNIGIEVIEIISDNGSTPQKPQPLSFSSSADSDESDVENKVSFEKDRNYQGNDNKLEPDATVNECLPENCGELSKDDHSEHEDDILLLENLTTRPRRSTRNQANNAVNASTTGDMSFTPSVPRIRGSVFGGKGRRGLGPVCHARTPNTTELVRARTIRQEKEKGLEELRQQLGSGGVDGVAMDAEEEVFAKIAADEDRKRKLRDFIFNKYERPTPLFVHPCDVSLSKIEFPVSEAPPDDQLLRELLAVANHSEVDVGEIFSRSLLKNAASSAERLFPIVEMLFYQVVYDDTDDVPGARSRNDAFWALHELLPSCYKLEDSRLPRIPSLMEVLESYGAVFRTRDLGYCSQIALLQSANEVMGHSVTSEPLKATETAFDYAERSGRLHRSVGMEVGSLDHDIVTHRDEDLAPITVRAMRNLGRAFRLFQVAACSCVPLSVLLVRSSARESSSHDVRACALAIVSLCAAVLVSPFGSQLFRDVGRLISCVLERVSESDWPTLRLQAAQTIARSSQQLSVQVELVTYLLPYLTTRSRGLALDTTYLVMCQWCTGPSSCPKAIDVSELIRSVDASRAGTSFISFMLSDILLALGSFPELDKNSDPVWACGVMRLLKLAVADDDVLKRRKAGDIGIVLELVKKYRKSFVRVVDGVPVQDMRIALDALRNVIHGFGENDAVVNREVCPLARLKPRQTSISTFGLLSD